MTQKTKRQPVFWKNLAAGYISGVANILSGQPFDICKVRIQSANGGSFPVVLKNIIKNEGALSLWKGSFFPLVTFGLCNSICFAVNEYVKHYFRNKNNTHELSLFNYYIAGALAGVANSVVSSPMEHIRIRMQTQKSGADQLYKGSIDAARKIFKQHGLQKGIYKGYTISLYREFFLYGAYFSIYEKVKHMEKNPGFAWLMISGGVGGCAGWLGGFLIDGIKSRVQTDSFTNPKYKSLWNVPKQLSLRDLSRGFTPGFIRAFPVNAITFVTFEIACNFIYGDHQML